MRSFLVTGAAGFIGYHVSQRLLARGDRVVGLDNLNSYYDPALKGARIEKLESNAQFSFHKADLKDQDRIESAFADNRPEVVIHLAAQPGVRYSLENPNAYVESNLTGFVNVIEGCRRHAVQHLVFASSSSVYGANTKLPFSTDDRTDRPVSLYGATKKANEVIAHAYSHLFAIPATGLRFFTAYGPWGRPDMSYFSFTKAILEGRTIDVYNNGQMERDFTYIDDIVEGVVRIADLVPSVGVDGTAPYSLYNIGNHTPVPLLDFIAAIEKALGLRASLRMLPMQQGDVKDTCADTDSLTAAVGFQPSTPLGEGIEKFVAWYRSYYRV